MLLPADENFLHSTEYPTSHLRAEHDRMRDLLHAIYLALQQQRTAQTLENFSRLQQLMDRHHEKEEEILLPRAGHALLEKRAEVMARLKQLDWKSAPRIWKI